MKFINEERLIQFWLNIAILSCILVGVIILMSCTPYWYWETDLPQANIRIYYSDKTYKDFPIHHIDKIKVTTYDIHHVKVEWEGINPL